MLRFSTLLLAIVVFLITNLSAQEIKNVLFIGNSYTYVNDLPATINSLAQTHGDKITYESSAPGGYTFQQHSTNTTSLSKIAQGNWDFVVLQEQSQIPSFPPGQVATDCLPFAQILVDSIKSANSCTEPLFFMTWGRENGDAANCPYYTPLCTYEGMQKRLRDSYLLLGSQNQASVSPVGAAWWHTRNTDPTIDLYTSDGSHPSVQGTYLAACVFYAVIFRKSPIGLDTLTIPSQQALTMQQIADQVVFDSLSEWTAYGNLSYSDFDFTVQDYTVSFSSQSLNSDHYNWSFGDGAISTDQAPIHTYGNSGTYNVEFASGNECNSHIISKEITIEVSTGINTIDSNIKIWPNPSDERFNIEINNMGSESLIRITDMNGKVHYSATTSEKTTVIETKLEPGLYFVELINTTQNLMRKLLVY